jgi:hypothetical protein
MSPRHPATSPTHPAAEFPDFGCFQTALRLSLPGRVSDRKNVKFKSPGPARIVANTSTLLTRALIDIQIKMS